MVGDKIKARYDSEDPDDNIECYINGLYQIMGTLIYRGCKSDNFISENVLIDLFNNIDIDKDILNENDKNLLEEFKNKKIRWNNFKRDLRIQLLYYIYNYNIKID